MSTTFLSNIQTLQSSIESPTTKVFFLFKQKRKCHSNQSYQRLIKRQEIPGTRAENQSRWPCCPADRSRAEPFPIGNNDPSQNWTTNRKWCFGRSSCDDFPWCRTRVAFGQWFLRAISKMLGKPLEMYSIDRFAAEWCRSIWDSMNLVSDGSWDEQTDEIRLRFDQWSHWVERLGTLIGNTGRLTNQHRNAMLKNLLRLTDDLCLRSITIIRPTGGFEIQTHKILCRHVCTVLDRFQGGVGEQRKFNQKAWTMARIWSWNRFSALSRTNFQMKTSTYTYMAEFRTWGGDFEFNSVRNDDKCVVVNWFQA